MDPALQRIVQLWYENERRAVVLRRVLLVLIRRRLDRLPRSSLQMWANEKANVPIEWTFDPAMRPRTTNPLLISLTECVRILRGMSLEQLADLIDHEVLVNRSWPVLHDESDPTDHSGRYLARPLCAVSVFEHAE
jgi:hypothetical protein